MLDYFPLDRRYDGAWQQRTGLWQFGTVLISRYVEAIKLVPPSAGAKSVVKTEAYAQAQPFSPMKALRLLSTLQRVDIVLPTTDGREIRLRRTEPTTEQKSLLQQLGLELPERFELNRKCSVDPAVA